MNSAEAFDRVENSVVELKIVDAETGLLLLPANALAVVARFQGKDWERTSRDFMESRIDADTYCERQLKLVREYRKYLYQRRIERKLMNEEVLCRGREELQYAPDIDEKWLPLFMRWGCSEDHARRALGLERAADAPVLQVKTENQRPARINEIERRLDGEI